MAMEVSDWRTGKKVAGCVEYLGDKKIFTDVTFVFPKDGGKKCTGHKLILSMRSAVFEAMFYGSMAETGDQITIDDIEATIFELVLRFVYTDAVDLDGDNVLKCLFLAKKYCMDDLIVCCKLFLEEFINTNNVCSVYEQSKFFDEIDLQEKCRVYILENAGEIFQGNDIVKLSKESLITVLSGEGLPTSELENFQTVLRWSDEQCIEKEIDASLENKRIALEGVVEKIRFPLMTLTEFAEHVTPSKILSDRELLNLFQFFATRKTTTPGRVAQYISLPRTIDFHIDLSDVHSSSQCTYNKTNEQTFVLECSHEINITAIKGCNQTNFKSVVIKKVGNDEHISSLHSLEECSRNDVNGEYNINPTLKIPRKTKTAVSFQLKPTTRRGHDISGFPTIQTVPEYVLHRGITFKYESGELAIVISEIPTALTGIRCKICINNMVTGKEVKCTKC